MYQTPHARDIKVNWDWIAAETHGSMAQSLGAVSEFDDQESHNPGADMPWQVDMEALFEFVREQADSVNSTPITPSAERAFGPSARDTVKDVQALWMAAGIAQIGLAIVDNPERFIHELPDKKQLHLALVTAPTKAQS